MVFQYTDMNSKAAFCGLERKGNLIIATELAENTGASVTNSCDYIATQYCTQNDIPFGDLIFVEHYDQRSYEGRGNSEDFSLVTFRQGERFGKPHFTNPEWKPLRRDEYQDLLDSHSLVS